MSKQLSISRAPAKADKPLTPSEFLDTLPGVVPSAQMPKEAGEGAVTPTKPRVQRAPPPAMPAAPVSLAAQEKERVQRLTLDIPWSLHYEIKVACARNGTSMKDEVMGLLEKHFRQKKG